MRVRTLAFLVAAGLAAVLAGPALSAGLPVESTLQSLTLDPVATLAAANLGRVVIPVPGDVLIFDLVPNPIALGAVWGLDGVPLGVVDEVVTFKGTANGHPARLAATPMGVFAGVFGPDPLFIQPASMLAPGAPATLHHALRWSQYPPVIPDHPEPGVGTPTNHGPVTPPATAADEDEPASAGRFVRFLVEGDWEFYKTWNPTGLCNACWTQVQQAVLNNAEALFEEQTGLEFLITSFSACSTFNACPYPGLPPSMALWLQAFRDRWEGIAGEPAHDLGHLIIGTNLPTFTGMAGLAVVGTSWGYALSEFAAKPVDLGLTQYAIAAHEIGHNFNGVHAESDPIPPALVPTGLQNVVWTIMRSGVIVQYEFSAGTWDPTHNNAARIVNHAVARLPPPP